MLPAVAVAVVQRLVVVVKVEVLVVPES